MSSKTGEAILSGEPRWAEDLTSIKDGLPDAARAYMESRTVGAVCSVPLNLRGGVAAAINVYRINARPFHPEDIERLVRVASRIPYLYDSVVNRVGLELLDTVTKVIRSAPPPEGLSERESKDSLRVFLQKIVDLVAATFNAIECSIYLEDPLSQPGVYQLEATLWPWSGRQQPRSYSKGHGLTGYCIEHQVPVRIFDLDRYGEDLEFIRSQYPGIHWSDSTGLVSSAREFFAPVGELPPLSFMCAPIIGESRSLGALRCRVTRTGPHYFDDRQVRFLCMVAEQIGNHWADHVRIRQAALENQRWRTLVEGVSRLNGLVHEELRKREPSEQRIFEHALRLLAQADTQEAALCVCLQDEKTKELYVAATHGKRWEQGSEKEIAERKRQRYPANGGSAAAHAFRTGELVIECDPKNSRFRGDVFPDIRSMIIAPISSDKTKFGVLEVRVFDSDSIPGHARVFVDLLGRQLGLYHFLALETQELNRVQNELGSSLDVQQRVYEDFHHQMKTPVMAAHQMANQAVRSFLVRRLAPGELCALRAVCRRAERVATNMGLFAALTREDPIRVTWKALRYEQVAQTLSEATEDHAVMVPPERELHFAVDFDSLRVLETTPAYADQALFEQAVDNLLDNAGKYSFARTTVTAKGGVTRRNNETCFYLAVVNRGFEIPPPERSKLIERGYRGTKAILSTGEGAGIGLWIVDKIMRAHGGWLEILPTNERGLNEFRLLFRTGIPKDLQ